MKHLKKMLTEQEYLTFKAGGQWVLPNVSFIKDTKKVYFNAKTQNTTTPRIYAKYASIGNIGEIEGLRWMTVGYTSHIQKMSINGKNVNFTPPTKVQQPLEVLSSDIEILSSDIDLAENNVYNGNVSLAPLFWPSLSTRNYTFTITPKDPSIVLNGNYRYGAIVSWHSSGVPKKSIIITTSLDDGLELNDITYDSSKIILNTEGGNLFLGVLMLRTLDVFGGVDNNLRLLFFIADENNEPIDSLFTINKDLYTDGLTPNFHYTDSETYDVTLDMVNTTANCGLFSHIVTDSIQEDSISSTVYMTSITDIKFENIENIEYMCCNSAPFLSSVTFTEGLKNINFNFIGCPITKIEIPSTIEIIDTSFNDCSSLSSITCHAKVAPNIFNDDVELTSFDGCSPTGTLYYPKGSDYSSWLTAFGEGWTGVEI